MRREYYYKAETCLSIRDIARDCVNEILHAYQETLQPEVPDLEGQNKPRTRIPDSCERISKRDTFIFFRKNYFKKHTFF